MFWCQEEPTGNVSSSNFTTSTKGKFFDDFEVVDVDKVIVLSLSFLVLLSYVL